MNFRIHILLVLMHISFTSIAAVRGEKRDTEDVQSLRLMMESLKTQLTSQSHLCQEHKAAFEAERHVLRLEKEAVIQRNTQEARRLSQQ